MNFKQLINVYNEVNICLQQAYSLSIICKNKSLEWKDKSSFLKINLEASDATWSKLTSFILFFSISFNTCILNSSSGFIF